VLLAYAVVATLTFGTLAGFGLVSGPASPGASPQRPDRAWWLLAPNPYVIAADAAPGPGAAQPSGPVLVRPRILVLGGGRCAIPGNDACAGRTRGRPARVTPHVYRLPEGGPLFADAKPLPRPSAADSLSAISRAARDARGGHGARPGVNQAPVWPYGLGFYVLLGAASLWCAAACLRAPARKLRPGTGIA